MREHVGSPLEWCETAIAERPLASVHAGGGQAAADATEVGSGNAELLRFAGAAAEGLDVVEDAVVAGVDLIDGIGRKNVSFREGRIAPVVFDVLVLPKALASANPGAPPGMKTTAWS